MKIKVKLTAGFFVVAFLIVIPILVNWTGINKIKKYSNIIDIKNNLLINIYLEEVAADNYIRIAGASDINAEDRKEKIEGLVKDYFKIHNTNKKLLNKLVNLLKDEQERKILLYVLNKHNKLLNLFNENYNYYKNEVERFVNQKELGIKIANIRHGLKKIITDPDNFNEFSKNVNFYSSEEGIYIGRNRNVLSLFRELGYLEKKYIWQYKDDEHLNRLIHNITELENIIVILNISSSTKEIIKSKLKNYRNNVMAYSQLITENDIDKLYSSAYSYYRQLWEIRHIKLKKDFVDNSRYGNLFKKFYKIKVENKERNVSFEYLLYELGHHEKELIFQDKGEKTYHYNEILETYASIETLTKTLSLPEEDKEKIINNMTLYKKALDNMMEVRRAILSLLVSMKEDKTKRISAVRDLIEEIQVGDKKNNYGLEFLGNIQDKKIQNQFNVLFLVNLVVGFLAFAIAVVLSLIISSNISAPIIKLKNAADRIGKGDLKYKIDIKSEDEVGELAEVFNRMTKELEKSKREMCEKNKKLENITKDLKKSKEQLEEKVEELEKFQKVTIDREMKIIELKKKIAKLKKKNI